MTHIINRLELDLNCSDEEQALNIRHNFSVTLLDNIIEVTDSICSRLVNDAEWLRIDKLELDLGTFLPGNFEQEFGEIFFQKLEAEITRHVLQISPTEKAVSKKRAQVDLLKYFLQYGTLPWWGDSESTDINEIFSTLWANEQTELKNFLYQQRFNTTIWQRAAFQLNQVNKIILINGFTELHSAIDSFRKWIGGKVKSWDAGGPANQEAVLTTFSNIILRNAGTIFEEYPGKNTCINSFEETMHLYFHSERTVVDNLINQIKITGQVNMENHAQKESGNNANVQPVNVGRQNNLNTFLQGGYSSSGPLDQQDEKILVKHAGIILLAAFLNPFFNNLGLLDGGAWKGKNEQYRAVHLLKFISTGSQQNPEFNLTLEKVICGMHLVEPLPVEVILEDNEINEVQSLLESVIEHWKALKNTSVNGLRESFLKRDGTFQKKEMDWLLQVERKTLDVLIDSIPWGYSTLTFPWTEQKLLVEW